MLLFRYVSTDFVLLFCSASVDISALWNEDVSEALTDGTASLSVALM
jgi:hypothetical protein